jgi:hypothetical protein
MDEIDEEFKAWERASDVSLSSLEDQMSGGLEDRAMNSDMETRKTDDKPLNRTADGIELIAEQLKAMAAQMIGDADRLLQHAEKIRRST